MLHVDTNKSHVNIKKLHIDIMYSILHLGGSGHLFNLPRFLRHLFLLCFWKPLDLTLLSHYLLLHCFWTPLDLTTVPSSSSPPLLASSSPPLLLNTSWSYLCSFVIFSTTASEHLLILPLFLHHLLFHCFWTPLDLTSVPSSSSLPLLLNTSWSYLCSFIIFSSTTSKHLLILPLFLHLVLLHYF